MPNALNLIGQTYGELQVISRTDNNKQGRTMWVCVCKCGKLTTVQSNHLKTGNTKSCGCLIDKENKKRTKYTKDFKIVKRLYNIRQKMISRCYREKDKDYIYYGAKGVKICDEWLNNFENFQLWSLENGYSENLTIDRINPYGNYEPSNCRWATIKEQNQNKRIHFKK